MAANSSPRLVLQLRRAVMGLVATLGVSATARAETPADALFWQARREMQAGQYTAACRNFAASQQLEPAAGTLLNLGVCEELIGKPRAAFDHLSQCLAALGPHDERRAVAEEHLAALTPRIALLRLELVPGPRPTAIRLDGAVIEPSAIGLALAEDPGVHEIVATYSGGRSFRLAIELHAGEHVTRTIGPPSVHATPPTDQRIANGQSRYRAGIAGGSTRRTWGYVLGGAGVAGLATAGVLGILIMDRQSTVWAHCPEKVCDDEGYRAGEEGKAFVVGSIVAAAAGSALFGVGAYLVASSASREQRGVLISAKPLAGGAGVELEGAF